LHGDTAVRGLPVCTGDADKLYVKHRLSVN